MSSSSEEEDQAVNGIAGGGGARLRGVFGAFSFFSFFFFDLEASKVDRKDADNGSRRFFGGIRNMRRQSICKPGVDQTSKKLKQCFV